MATWPRASVVMSSQMQQLALEKEEAA